MFLTEQLKQLGYSTDIYSVLNELKMKCLLKINRNLHMLHVYKWIRRVLDHMSVLKLPT